MRSYNGALILSDWCPYKKRKRYQRALSEDTGRRQPFAGQEENPPQKPTPVSP